MKKLFYLLTLVFIVSCSDSDTIIDIDESDLIGTWNLTKYEQDLVLNIDYGIVKVETDTETYGKDFDFTLSFSDTPKEFVIEGEFISVTQYDDGTGAVENSEYETGSIDGLNSGDWSFEGNILTLKSDDDNLELVVDSYTENKLVLKNILSESYTDDGVSFEAKTNYLIVFER